MSIHHEQKNSIRPSRESGNPEKHLGILICLALFCGWLFFSPTPTYAQITLDGSLGPKGALAGPNYTIEANVGKQVGGNLFHSFGDFNVHKGESATFTGPDAVNNIIGRVTGGNSSLIDGTIRSEIPEANVYLVNPSGVMFGPNASLEVDGSFHVSTADYLKLGDKGRFNAATPSDSLLTSAPPEAFGFLGSNPAAISIQGSKLTVPEGETLSVIGGDIQINGGKLFAPSGQVNLASVGSTGEIVPNAPGQAADLHVDSFDRLGRIELTQEAFIASSGQAGGSVVIRGGQLLVDRSDIGADTRGNVDGSTTGVDINIRGDAVFSQDAFVSTLGRGSGRVGDINVEADNVTIQDGATLLSRTTGPTEGGKVKIAAHDSLSVSGKGALVGTLTTEQGRDGGDILLSMRQLTVEKGGIIQTATDASATDQGAGDAGNVVVEADRVILRDGGSRIASITASTGQGGDITINASEFILVTGQTSQNAASIATLTAGSGNAGHIQIATPDLRLEGGLMSVGTAGAGRAGNIEIDTARVTLTGGAFIDSSTFKGSSGHGGKISINATESINLSGVSVDNEPSLVSSVSSGSGRGGEIELHARGVQLTGGATVSASSATTGDAGNVTILAEDAFRSERGVVATEAVSGNGGNITLRAGSLARLSKSQITATVEGGQGKGGNITIEPTLTVLDQSTVTANAFGGSGGNVRIASEVFLASPGSEVTASSTLGIDGDVDIQSPVTNISGSFAPLPETFVNVSELLPVRCAARLHDGQASSFVLRGRDTLPASPDGVLPSPMLLRNHTDSMAINAASVSGWKASELSQASVEVDCWR